MAQITNGARVILSHPVIYSFFQTLMGAHRLREHFVRKYVKPTPEMKILDLGCGPADILAHLTGFGVDYYGFDISEAYICQAKSRFGDQGAFYCKQLKMTDISNLPKFDIVIAIGLLHHLTDDEAADVMQIVLKLLKEEGKLLTVDPCLAPAQNKIARFLINYDRGQNVRDKVSYESLARQVFTHTRSEIRHQSWIPYTHCFMICRR